MIYKELFFYPIDGSKEIPYNLKEIIKLLNNTIDKKNLELEIKKYNENIKNKSTWKSELELINSNDIIISSKTDKYYVIIKNEIDENIINNFLSKEERNKYYKENNINSDYIYLIVLTSYYSRIKDYLKEYEIKKDNNGIEGILLINKDQT